MNLEQSIEALLFWRGEPVTVKELAKDLSSADTKVDETAILEALGTLEASLSARGIVLIRKSSLNKHGESENGQQEVMLGTSADAGKLIEKLTKDQLSKDLGKASLETLSIILYKGPVKRSEIDYIRGVNSTFILRNLLIRGLIDKRPAPNDNRASIYSPSFELLSFLGISKIADMPNFSEVQGEIKKFEESFDEPQTQEQPEIKEEMEPPTETEEEVETQTAL